MKKLLHFIAISIFMLSNSGVFGQNPSLTSNPSNFRYCIGDPGLQMGVTNTVVGITYNLQKNDGGWQTVAGVEGSNGTAWFPGIWTTGAYRCEVLDPPFISNTANVQTANYPEFKFNITGGGGYCSGFPEEFEIGLDGSQAVITYRLYRNGSLVAGTVKPGTGDPIIFGTFDQPGEYTATGSRFSCSIDMNGKVFITQFPNPTANFTPQYFFPGDEDNCSTVEFNNQTTGGTPPYIYSWNFGDGTPLGTEANPIHVFPAFGVGQQTFSVTLNVVDANGCVGTIVKDVIVTKRPDASISGNGLYGPFGNCNPDPLAVFNLTITNTSTTTLTNVNYWVDWEGTGNFLVLGPGFTTASHTYLSKGSFPLTMKVEGTNGCIDTRIYNVYNGSDPEMSMNTSQLSGCAPFPVQFTMSNNVYQNTPGTIYDFNFGDGTSIQYTQQTLPPPDLNGFCVIEKTYQISSCGYPNNAFVMNVNVNNPCSSVPYTVGGIKISKAALADFELIDFPRPGNIYLCSGVPNTFDNFTNVGCLITGNAIQEITNYYWDFGDGTASQEINPTHTYLNAGLYQVTLTAHTAQGINGNCGSNVSVRTVCVQDAPVASFTISENSGCAPFDFEPNNNSTAIGCANIQYLWIVNGGNGYEFLDLTGPNSQEPHFNFYEPGSYTLQLRARTYSNNILCGESFTEPITLQVKDVPEITFADGAYNLICGTGNFTVQASHVSYNDNLSPITQYLWTSDPPGPVFNNNTLAYPTITFNAFGTYNIIVVATNECGDSQQATLQIIVSPDIENNNIDYGDDLQLCAGMTLSLPLTGTTQTSTPPLTGGNNIFEYIWKIDTGLGWTTVGGNTPDLNYLSQLTNNPTKFLRVVKSSGCESFSNELIFIVHPAITGNTIITPPQHICMGETPGTISGSNPAGGDGNFEFLWQQSTDCNNPLSWGPAVGGSIDEIDFMPAALDVTTCYRRIVYSVSDFCENVSGLVTVNVYGEISNNTISHPNPIICEGDPPGTLTGLLPTQPGHNLQMQYTWQKAVAPDWIWQNAGINTQNYPLPLINETTRYRRIVTSPAPVPTNCNSIESNVIEFTVNPKPMVNAGPDQNTFNGGQVNLDGSASGGSGNYNYLWEPTNKIFSGQGTPNALTVNLFPPPNFIVFTLTVTDITTGCFRQDNLTVIISGESLTCSATAVQNAICIGQSVTLNGSALGGSGNYTYLWTLPGGGVQNGQQITHQPMNLGPNTYSLLVDDGATTTQCQVIVQVDDLPLVNSPSMVEICSGNQINYTPLANIPGSTFNWYSGANPFITGNSSGVGDITDALFNSSNEVQSIKYFILPTGPQPTMCSGNSFELTVLVNPTAQVVNSPIAQTVVSGQFSSEAVFTSNASGATFQWSSDDDCPGLLSYTTPASGDVLPSQLIEILDPNGPETCIITFYITPVVNGCPGVTHQYKIFVQQQPIQYTVTGGGEFCQGGSTSVYLSGSQTGVNYQLYRNGSIPVQPQKIGDGNPIVWTDVTQQGIYTVKGINQSNMVQAQMNGQVAVVVNPLPQIFVIVPQGDRCAPVTPRLSGSQAGVRYQLLRNGVEPPVQEVDGTGLPGFLIFNEQTEGGSYTIRAVNLSTLCTSMMIGALILHPLPEEFPIVPGGILCVGTILHIQASQPGIEYQLWLNNDPFGTFHIGDGGPIYFEQVTLPGTYRVFANDPVWGCDRFFSQQVIINPTPLQYEVTPGICCPGCKIVLNGWQTGVDYYLYFEDPADNSRILSVFGPVQGVAGEPTINFGQWWDEGTYTVLAKNAFECEIWMANSTTIRQAPAVFAMTPNGTGCGIQEIALDGSEVGVVYFLYKNLQLENSIPGTGAPISFGIYDITGIYTIRAKFLDPEQECWSQMIGSYEIIAFPTAFIVSPLPGIYCPCVNPTLSSSQAGINYFIENTTLGTVSIAYSGSGNPLPFDPVCEPGTYVIYALHPDYPSCKKYMTGGFTISLPPQVHNLSGPLPTVYCAGGTGVTLTLDNSQTNVKYQLYKTPGTAIGIPKDGTNGTSLTWDNVTAGEYFVVAVFANDPNCPTTMNNSVTVEEIPLPTVYAGDDGSICRSSTYEIPNVMMTNQSAFEWTIVSGLGVLQNAATTNPIYIPVDQDAGTTVQLQLEANGISACSGQTATDFVAIQIDPLPEIANAGDNGIICFDQTFTVSNVLLNNVSDWFWTVTTGNGTLDDPNLLNPTYTPAPGDAGITVLLTLEAAGNLTCVNEIVSDVVSVQVDPVPMVISATAKTICSGESVAYTPLSDIPGTSFTWTSTNTTLGCVSGNTVSGSELINDVVNNSCNIVQTIKYTILPVGPSSSNCVGNPVELIVTVNPVASITNADYEQSMNSNELSMAVAFQTNIVGVPVNFSWSGTASHAELQGWIDEGTGDIPAMNIWIDESGPNPPDYGAIEYTITPFVNGCQGNPFTYTIHVYLLPTVFNFTVQGSGEFCNDGQTCIDVILNYSQVGKTYKLYKNSAYQAGNDLPGTNSNLVWCINQPGIYTIKAINPNTGVEIWMSGSAEVISRPIPLNFTLAIQAPGSNCVPVTPRLNGSEVGAFYDLYFDDGVNPEPVLVQGNISGTGNALILDNQNQPGNYFVIGKLSYTQLICERRMSGTIIADALPTEFALTSNNGFCAGLDEICLTSSESDVNYRLYKDNNPYGPVLPGNSGMLCFGTITQSGTYRIHAKKVASLCEVIFQQQVVVHPIPLKFTMSPFFACSGAEIKLNNCQVGIDYFLYWQPDSDDPTREWIQKAGPVSCSGGNTISFGIWDDVGEYRIKGVSGLNCETWMENSSTIAPKPSVFDVQPQGFAGCMPTAIYLNTFDASVTYYLWREDQGNISLAATDDGTDGEVNFGLHSLKGVYTVKAKWTHQSFDCWSDMLGSIIIGKAPDIFIMRPSGSTCPPASFFLNNSESGVTYQLHSNTAGKIQEITSTGGAIYFNPVNNPDDYRIIAKNTLGCEIQMEGVRTVLETPNAYNVTIANGNICLDESIEIGVSWSDVGFTYELHRIAASNNPLDSKAGLDSPLSFSPTTPLVAGTYRVKAVNNISGCNRWMNNTITIHDPPDIYEIMANGQVSQSFYYCPPVTIGLNFSEAGIVYALIRDTEQVAFQVGTGASLDFGTWTEPGTYVIIANDLITTCDSEMNGFVNISDGPASYNLVADNPLYCIGDSQSVTLTLADSQIGVEYQLYKNDISNPVSAVKIGTNSALHWENVSQYGSGNYFVIAKFTGSPECEAPMLNAITIYELPLPSASLSNTSTICEGYCTQIPVELTGSILDWSLTYSVNGVNRTDILPLAGPHFLEICSSGLDQLFIQLIEIKYNASPFCVGTVTGTHTVFIQPLPSVDAGPDVTVCESLGVFGLLSAVASNYSSVSWQINGVGFLDDPATVNPNFSIPDIDAPATIEFILTAFGANECSSEIVTSTFTLQIDPLPNVFAGNNATICEATMPEFPLAEATAEYFSSVNWQVIGPGSLDNFAVLNPNYLVPDVTEPTLVEFILTATGVGLCLSDIVTSTFSLLIHPLPIVYAGADATVCESEEVFVLSEATASFYTTLNWAVTSGLGSFDNPTSLNPSYIIPDVNQPTIVQLVLTAAGTGECAGSVVSSSFSLQIDPLPEIFAGDDVTVCESSGLFPLSNATANYYSELLWSVIGGIGAIDNPTSLNPNYLIPDIDVPTSVEIVLTALGTGDCMGEPVSSTFTIQIEPLPNIFAGNDFTICESDEVFVLSQASAEYFSEILWEVNGPGGIDNPSVLNPSFVVPPITEPTLVELIMHATGTGACGIESVSDTMILLINPLPNVFAGNDATVCESTGIYALTGATAEYFSALEWEVVGVGSIDDPSALNPNFLIPDVSQPTLVELRLSVVGFGECANDTISHSFLLQIEPLPNVFAGNNATICEADGIFILSEATAEYFNILSWTVNGPGLISDPAILNPTYIIPDVTESTMVELYLEVYGTGACEGDVVTSGFTLQIDPLPEINAGESIAVCVADNVQITGASVEFHSAFIWTIDTGNGTLDDPTKIDPTYYPNNSDAGNTVILKLTAISSGSCVGYTEVDFVEIAVKNLPVSDAGSGGTVCVNDPGGFTVPIGSATTTYSSSFSWFVDINNGYGQLVNNQTLTPTYIPHPLDAGKSVFLYLKAVGIEECEGYSMEDYCELKIGAKPVTYYEPINNNVDSTMCCCTPVYFKDLTNFGPFTKHPDQLISRRIWNFGDGSGDFVYNSETTVNHVFAGPGNYVVSLQAETEIDGVLSCTGYYQATVLINQLPSPDFTFSQVNYCDGKIQFTDISQGFNIAKFWWKFEDGVNSYYSDIQNPQFEYLTGGIKTVTFTVTDQKGCQNTVVKAVEVKDFFNFDIQHEGTCFDDLFSFWIIPETLSPVGNTITKYRWSFGDGSPVDENAAPLHRFNFSGNHTVLLIAEDASGCERIKSYSVFVPGQLRPEFSFTECAVTVDFTDLTPSIGNEIQYWIWNFGDGTIDTITPPDSPNVSHTFPEQTTYTVSLTVIDDLGCEAMLTIDTVRTICIEEKGLFIPTAMYPEYSANPNDEVRFFKPKGINIAEYRIQVFDLWGNMIWESTQLDSNGSPVEAWDGTYKNNLVPPGNYLWNAYAKFKDGTVWFDESIETKGQQGTTTGTVLVIR